MLLEKNNLAHLKVTDIKNYLYCPRLVYFHYNFPVRKKITFKMQYGIDAEKEITKLESKRKLSKYGLTSGKRWFRYNIYSKILGLSGRIDMLLESDGEYYPVDFKCSSGIVYQSYIYQLGGYALLLEDVFQKEVRKGYIYFIQQNKIVDIEISLEIRNHILEYLNIIRSIINSGLMPGFTGSSKKCFDCEYRNYCGDIF